VRTRSLRLGACLSLTGRYARFGTQAARGLEVWRALDGGADVVVEDDAGDLERVPAALRRLAGRCGVLLGPYSTRLMRAAGPVTGEIDRVLWNHGGSGDDVQAAWPGRAVSVLTPASRYALPFLRLLADEPAPLWIAEGRGSFGRQVAEGAERAARAAGLEVVRVARAGLRVTRDRPPAWHLLCAGSFEEDVAAVAAARSLEPPPRRICAVAAGILEFGRAVARPQGVLGVAQWHPGAGAGAVIGPQESDFVRRYAASAGAPPDYPAVQAAAAAALAAHCAREVGGWGRDRNWSAAAALDAATMFGRFKIDPTTGVQLEHEMVLVRWTPDGLIGA
jgi:ABC-type branched-subunit amino acid transport system substrate-binding protein